MKRELTCIVCPIGCSLVAEIEGGEVISVTGNTCPRGVTYGKQEVTDPRRYLTSTVRLESKFYSRLPVISSSDLPKQKVGDVVKFLDTVVVKAPVKVKDVIVKDVLGLGVDILATRSIEE